VKKQLAMHSYFMDCLAYQRVDAILVYIGRYILQWESKHVIAVSTAIQDWLASSNFSLEHII
jgi:hypothetical protein